MIDSRLNDIIEVLEELKQDNTVPRNIKIKIETIIACLKEDEELSIKVNKALNELDEISDDTNMQSYTRTQLWNIASMLEAI